MISQFYVLSPRGDCIIHRDYRGDIVKGTAEIFYRRVKAWNSGDAPPVFLLDGITYVYLKRAGLYFVATTQQNISPSYCLELLEQMIKLFKDFCGVLNEEAVRRNFILIYEILDEVLDIGYPQNTTTERLKQCIHNEAILVDIPHSRNTIQGLSGITAGVSNPFPIVGSSTKTVPSIASHRPVGAVHQQAKPFDFAAGGVLALTKGTLGTLGPGGIGTSGSRDKNEIFVDILERLTVVMNSSGTVLNSQVDGCIQIKSYLSNSPSLRLALNEDIIIKNEYNNSVSTANRYHHHHGINSSISSISSDSPPPPQLDDCNFHECVDLREFDTARVLNIRAFDGQVILMNYRITDEFRIPFKIRPTIEQTSPTKLELVIDLRSNIPSNHYAGNVLLSCPIPKNTTSVTTEASPKSVSQSLDYIQQESKIVWNIRKFQGGSDMALRCRMTLADPLAPNLPTPQILALLRKTTGPISLSFEIPMFNVSNLQVRYLRIASGNGHSSQAPFRWVRYVTQSSSYVCRL